VDIQIFSDVVCPWCWIGERKLLAALEDFTEAPVNVHWRAFQLDPSAASDGVPLTSWLAGRYGGEDSVRRMFEHVTPVAAGVGLELNFDKAISANTLDAHRLIWWSASLPGDGHRTMVDALHRAHFTDGRNLGSLDDLVAVAASLGHDPMVVREFLESPAGLNEVREELAAGRDFGITGVPTFIFANKYAISGAQEVATFREVLDEVVRREAESSTI
jgi:predicted DsbA family dithiol-disulfide isomerase